MSIKISILGAEMAQNVLSSSRFIESVLCESFGGFGFEGNRGETKVFLVFIFMM